jgi:uncharacterized protein (TIGR03437 family)
MLRTAPFLILCFASLGFSQTTPVLEIISAASVSSNVSPESLASAFGAHLADDTAAAQSVPWPTSLGGVTIQVKDSAGVSRAAGILFVSPTQINFQVPTGTAAGTASIQVNTQGTTLHGSMPITRVAPALFSIDTNGDAAATAVRIPIATQFQSPLPVFDCSGATCKLVPLPLGIDTPIYVSLYATGVHGYAQNTPIRVDIGTDTVNALYAGPQGQFPGLDQINIPLPLSQRGKGTIEVTVTVDGMTSNPVKIAVE